MRALALSLVLALAAAGAAAQNSRADLLPPGMAGWDWVCKDGKLVAIAVGMGDTGEILIPIPPNVCQRAKPPARREPAGPAKPST